MLKSHRQHNAMPLPDTVIVFLFASSVSPFIDATPELNQHSIIEGHIFNWSSEYSLILYMNERDYDRHMICRPNTECLW